MPKPTGKRLLTAAVLALFTIGFYQAVSKVFIIEELGCFSASDGMLFRAEHGFYRWEPFSYPSNIRYRVTDSQPTVLTDLFCDADDPPKIPEFFEPWDFDDKLKPVSTQGYMPGAFSHRNIFGILTMLGSKIGRQYAFDFPALFVPRSQAGPEAWAFVEFLKVREAQTSGTIQGLRESFMASRPVENIVWLGLLAEFKSQQTATPTPAAR